MSESPLRGGLGSETLVITRGGIRTLGSLAGASAVFLTTAGGWVLAPVRVTEPQPLLKITLRRQGIQKIVFAAGTHCWLARSPADSTYGRPYQRTSTDALGARYQLQYLFGKTLAGGGPAPVGIIHGIVFGDGTRGSSNGLVRLCGDKRELLPWFSNHPNLLIDADQVQVSRLPWSFKELPSLRENRTYLYGWLMGLTATDGSCAATGAVHLSTSRLEVAEHVRSACAIVGIGTYGVRSESRVSNLTGRSHVMHKIALMRDTLSPDFFLRSDHRSNFVASGGSSIKHRNWYVVSVESTERLEPTLGVELTRPGAFALADNLLSVGFDRVDQIQ